MDVSLGWLEHIPSFLHVDFGWNFRISLEFRTARLFNNLGGVLNVQSVALDCWTSDGEHYHFRYDFAYRTRQTTMLSRELEIHYNADHRVIASRDYGGERYAIELDDAGNMTGLTLPDGNQLRFKYDEYAGLLEETDPLGRTIRYQYHHLTTLVTQASYSDGSTWTARSDTKGNGRTLPGLLRQEHPLPLRRAPASGGRHRRAQPDHHA